MDEIEVLIKIPKEDYEFIYDEFADGDMPDGKSLTRTILYAIAKGTVLPKGHDKLILACAVKAMINDGISTDTDADKEYACELIDNIMAVIEADKE